MLHMTFALFLCIWFYIWIKLMEGKAKIFRKEVTKIFLMVILGISVALIFFVVSWFELELLPDISKISEEKDIRGAYGALGDYIGGLLNPIFGFLGICVLLLTLHYTREDLKETKKALRQQEKEGKLARITDLIFRQCEAINKKLSHISIAEKSGSSAFNHLKMCKKIVKQGTPKLEGFKSYKGYMVSFLTDSDVKDYIEILNNALSFFKKVIADDEFDLESKSMLIGIVEVNLNFPFLLEATLSIKESDIAIQDVESMKLLNSNDQQKIESVISQLFELKRMYNPDLDTITISANV